MRVDGNFSGGFYALLRRFGKGSGYKGSKLPEKPLVYYGYEASPFCKVSTMLYGRF